VSKLELLDNRCTKNTLSIYGNVGCSPAESEFLVKALRLVSSVLLFAALALALSSCTSAQKPQTQTATVDWSSPDGLDIYNADLGNFVDIDVNEYGAKAQAAYEAKNYEEAARLYLYIIRLERADAGSLYNLSCCYALLGRADLASKYLLRAVKAGFTDFEHIAKDPDFDQVRSDPAFTETTKSLAAMDAKSKEGAGNFFRFKAPALMNCGIHLPETYDPAKSYPMIVGLHGYGDLSDNFVKLWRAFPETDVIFVAPEAPYALRQGGKHVGFSWGPEGVNDEKAWIAGSRLSEEYIADLVGVLRREYHPSKVYLMGFSQGCSMTYTIGIKYYSLFAGLFCFGGWLAKDEIGMDAIKAAKGLPVFVCHASDDPVVAFDAAVQARQTLTDCGYSITSIDFKGGHRIDRDALKQITDWINGK